MRDITWCLVGGLAVLVAGCGDSEASVPPPCADVSWIRDDLATVTGPPTLSASQIAAGDPLTISVPVDEETRKVSVGFPVGGRIIENATGETDGGETVEILVEDTNLPAGSYLAGQVVVRGDDSQQTGFYYTDDPDMPYVLEVTSPPPVRSCTTDILAPTLAVVSESSNRP